MNRLILGDNYEALRRMPSNYAHSIVTDGPYGLGKEPDMVKCLQDWIDHGYHEVGGKGFMGKTWDAFVPQPIFWKGVFRVLKPGGHVLSFGGTRTYDLMVLAIRLAGFEIRDTLVWMYGGGMPKGHDVAKNIDKQAGAARDVLGYRKHSGTHQIGTFKNSGDYVISAPNTLGAKQWEGWNIALSPSHEPILLARKPLDKGLTIAQNVLKWGTGALNITATRIPTEDGKPHYSYANGAGGNGFHGGVGRDADGSRIGNTDTASTLGRWPSNLLLANVPSVIGLFPENAKSGKMGPQHTRHAGGHTEGDIYGKFKVDHPLAETIADSGSASRYFFRTDLLPIEEEEMNLPIHVKAYYCAKPSQYERNLGADNRHPTIKPVALMHHLVQLVTPPKGICIDPFMGSGTTGIAANLVGGLLFIGIEMERESWDTAKKRIDNWPAYREVLERHYKKFKKQESDI